jgi:hypothetical protein
VSFYSNLQATASRLLASKGQAVTLQSMQAGTYDPDTSLNTQAAPTAFTLRGVLLDFAAGKEREGGELVQAGDKELYLEAKAGQAPKIDDKVVMADGTVYTVLSVGEVNPAGTPVVYDLHLRR